MGEAKRRGTYEQRRDQAITGGRVRTPAPRREPAPARSLFAFIWAMTGGSPTKKPDEVEPQDAA